MTKRKQHDAVSIDIAASPEVVYDLVSDVTRMGEWSPECYRCSWTKGATGPAVGARFLGRSKGKRGPSWFTPCVVTVADRAREFAFNRSGPAIGSYTWSYTLEPTATGTTLHESFDAAPPVNPVMNWITEKWTGSNDRDADLHQGMLTTIARIKSAAESKVATAAGRPG